MIGMRCVPLPPSSDVAVVGVTDGAVSEEAERDGAAVEEPVDSGVVVGAPVPVDNCVEKLFPWVQHYEYISERKHGTNSGSGILVTALVPLAVDITVVSDAIIIVLLLASTGAMLSVQINNVMKAAMKVSTQPPEVESRNKMDSRSSE